jgi:hypothetical protein
MKKARFPPTLTEDASVRKESGLYEQEETGQFGGRVFAVERRRFAAGVGLDPEERDF